MEEIENEISEIKLQDDVSREINEEKKETKIEENKKELEKEKIKEKEREYEKQNEQFELIIDESEIGERELRKKCEELKKLAEKIHKVNILKRKENKIKDAEIDSLNNKIEKLNLNNYDLELAIQKELELRNKYEKEQKRIADYCNSLKKKFDNMEKTIQDYENTIKSMNQENVKLQETYEKKIEEIELNNTKLEKKIEDRINLYNQQKKEIIQNQSKIENLTKEIEQQKNAFNERFMLNKIRYDELEKKFSSIQKKLYELQMVLDIKKTESKNARIEKSKGKVDEIEIIEKKIKDYENNNAKLTTQIAELTKQWKEMSMGTISTMDMMNSQGNINKHKRNSSAFRSHRRSITKNFY